MAWRGMAWHGMAWHGMAWHGVRRQLVDNLEEVCLVCNHDKNLHLDL